jgi:hypothetical protein
MSTWSPDGETHLSRRTPSTWLLVAAAAGTTAAGLMVLWYLQRRVPHDCVHTDECIELGVRRDGSPICKVHHCGVDLWTFAGPAVALAAVAVLAFGLWRSAGRQAESP